MTKDEIKQAYLEYRRVEMREYRKKYPERLRAQNKKYKKQLKEQVEAKGMTMWKYELSRGWR